MKDIEVDTVDPRKENIKNFNKDIQCVFAAQDSLLKKLFVFVTDCPSDFSIGRKAYIKAMIEVQLEFELVEGNTRLVLFVLEQLSRSPKIIDSHNTKRKYKINK